MPMQSETIVTNRSDEARILPTYCPWCLAVAALILTVVAAVLIFI